MTGMATETQIRAADTVPEDVGYPALAGEHVPPCISLYLTSRAGSQAASQLFPRLRKLLRSVEPPLQTLSMAIDEAEQLLVSHWPGAERNEIALGAQGVAVFLSRDSFTCIHLPAPLPDRAVVSSEFFIKPLLAVLPPEDHFFVLALAQNHVKLYEGSHRGLRERGLREAPASLREDLRGQSFERQYQLHTASSPASGQKGAVFHGPSLRDKDRIDHFLRDVQRGVAIALKDQQAPLILAAVDYYVPLYREMNTCPHLLDDSISGNPDLLSPDAIHAAAWRIINDEHRRRAARIFSVYAEHINTSLTSSNLRETLLAAYRGLVRFLFISPAAERWGSFVPPETVHVHAANEPGDTDLLNLAAIFTIRHGGHVFVIPPGELRPCADLAAVFRFALGLS